MNSYSERKIEIRTGIKVQDLSAQAVDTESNRCER